MSAALTKSDVAGSPSGVRLEVEADIVGGLARVARAEIAGVPAVRLHRPTALATDATVRFDLDGALRPLLDLRTVQSVALVIWFDVPRPRALLGDAHLRRLAAHIELVRALHAPGAFQTLFVGAAGADSMVMTRLKSVLADLTGLRLADREGDLVLRMRRPSTGHGWEVLIRLTPRPLGTRAWRVCHLPGALNATIAASMAGLSRPRPNDLVLNIGSGSGTLLIERLALTSAGRAIGCDIDARALDCARLNTAAAERGREIEWQPWDARALPLPAASVDTILGDLPYGHLVGSHADNLTLYPALLAETARVARPGARGVLISHEARLMERLLAASGDWTIEGEYRLMFEDMRPRIWVLVRRDAIAHRAMASRTVGAGERPRT